MSANEFADDALVIGQALWSMFLLFGGYLALAYADYPNPEHGAQAEAPTESGAACANKHPAGAKNRPWRYFHIGADLE